MNKTASTVCRAVVGKISQRVPATAKALLAPPTRLSKPVARVVAGRRHYSPRVAFQAASSSAAGRKPRLMLLGAPGVGKGTFAKILAPHFDIPHISTGDIVRGEIKAGTDLGKEVQQLVQAGQLVPDEIITKMALNALGNADGYLLDGFPRNVAQADALEEKYGLDLVMDFTLDESILVEKISSRRVCEGCGENYNLANIDRNGVKMTPLEPKVPGVCDKCEGKLIQRKDDAAEVVQDRLAVYAKETKPLTEYYSKKGILSQWTVIKGKKDAPGVIAVIEEALAKRK